MNRMGKAAAVFGMELEDCFILESPSGAPLIAKFSKDGLQCRIGKDKWAKANSHIFEGIFTGLYKVRKQK